MLTFVERDEIPSTWRWRLWRCILELFGLRYSPLVSFCEEGDGPQSSCCSSVIATDECARDHSSTVNCLGTTIGQADMLFLGCQLSIHSILSTETWTKGTSPESSCIFQYLISVHNLPWYPDVATDWMDGVTLTLPNPASHTAALLGFYLSSYFLWPAWRLEL